MGTTVPRHSTAKRPARLIALAVVVVLLAVGAVTVTLLLRGSDDDAARDDAPPAAGALASGDRPAATRGGSEGDGPAASGDRALAPPPPPTPGDARVAAPEPDRPVGTDTAAPVGTGAPAPLAEGVIATVRTITSVRTVPRGAGEKAGAGAVVRLDVRNETGEPVDLSALTVTATAGDDVPAPPSSGGVAAPLAGPLSSGGSRAGTYVFTLPPGASPSSLLVRAGLAGSPTVVTVRAR